MNKKVLNLLEYNKIIDLLSAQAGSELARERIKGFVPMSNMRMVKEALTKLRKQFPLFYIKAVFRLEKLGILEVC